MSRKTNGDNNNETSEITQLFKNVSSKIGYRPTKIMKNKNYVRVDEIRAHTHRNWNAQKRNSVGGRIKINLQIENKPIKMQTLTNLFLFIGLCFCCVEHMCAHPYCMCNIYNCIKISSCTIVSICFFFHSLFYVHLKFRIQLLYS